MRVKLDQDYSTLRAGAYPRKGDQLDAVMKALRALIDGKPLPLDALAVIEQVEDVKDRFPKRPRTS